MNRQYQKKYFNIDLDHFHHKNALLTTLNDFNRWKWSHALEQLANYPDAFAAVNNPVLSKIENKVQARIEKNEPDIEDILDEGSEEEEAYFKEFNKDKFENMRPQFETDMLVKNMKILEAEF